jgi:DNA-binding CsgD family transcriptional regulator
MVAEIVLRGRDHELAVLGGILDEARSARGSALVVGSGTGTGKSALLRAARGAAPDFLVLGTGGVATETGLQLGGLHRLLQPLSHLLPGLPERQRELLAVAAGRSTGPGDDVFGLCAALHRLVAEAAGDRPVLLCADDVQHLDSASARALAFVARRVTAAPVVVLFADGREPHARCDLFDGVPVLELGALDEVDALGVLADRSHHPVPEDLAHELVELASGNPLALVELAAALTPEQHDGHAPAPESLPPGSRVRAALRARFLRLSADAQRIVLLAVLDDHLDVDTVVRAAARADIALPALDEAVASGLVRVDGDAVAPPTTLVRSTLHAEASVAQTRAAHRLLAAVLDTDEHRLRHVWHRAAVAGAERDRLAGELAAAATAARAASDWATSARSWERAAALTRDPEVTASHLVHAAADHWALGLTRQARTVLRRARPLSARPDLRGAADLVRGGIELGAGVPAMAAATLLKAAAELGPTRRTAALIALVFACEASSIAGDHLGCVEAARRAARLRDVDTAPFDQLMCDFLDGLSATFRGRHDEAVPSLRRAVRLSAVVDDPRAKIWASQAAYILGDAQRSYELATDAAGAARDLGIVSLVPWATVYLSLSALLLDRHSAASSTSLEGMRVAEAIGQHNSAVDHLTILALVAALQGDRETAVHRLETAAAGVARRGLGRPSAFSSWAFACVDLADDRPADAFNRLRLMAVGAGRVHPAIQIMAAPHHVEAAVGCGEQAAAEEVLRRFDAWVTSTGSTARLALSHRCHALLAGRGSAADEHFREAIRLHRASGTALELAKTELLYGLRLRRERKPRAAREHLRDALKIFQRYQAEHWVTRVRAELRAAGETVEPGRAGAENSLTALTPQQTHIAQLVGEGATNREIAARLFLSHRTVEHHLRNIFARLEVRSRVELARLIG